MEDSLKGEASEAKAKLKSLPPCTFGGKMKIASCFAGYNNAGRERGQEFRVERLMN
jgi:hypothetical protein